MHVPHPLQFNKPRTTTGDISGATRRDVGQHFMVGWNLSTVPESRRRAATRGLDFTLFAGPSIFVTDQLFVTSLMLSLEKEIFPFDEVAFPGAQTQTVRENVIGYNAGVDMTWRFSKHVGVGLLLRVLERQESIHTHRCGAGRGHGGGIARRRRLARVVRLTRASAEATTAAEAAASEARAAEACTTETGAQIRHSESKDR